MVQYKLHYFNGRGLAEVCRLLFAAADVKYEDVRHDREEFVANFKEKTPFGELPALEVDGKIYGQARAIAAYLANEFGLYGKNNLEALAINEVIECIADVMTEVYKLIRMSRSDPAPAASEMEEARKNFKEKTLKPNWTRLQGRLQESGYFVGDSMTLADVAFFHAVDMVHTALGIKIKPEECIKDAPFPKLVKLLCKVQDQEGIAKWLKERPESDF